MPTFLLRFSREVLTAKVIEAENLEVAKKIALEFKDGAIIKEYLDNEDDRYLSVGEEQDTGCF